MPDQPKPPPYDQRIANESTAIEQCMKMGAVILNPQSPAGFGPRPPRA